MRVMATFFLAALTSTLVSCGGGSGGGGSSDNSSSDTSSTVGTSGGGDVYTKLPSPIRTILRIYLSPSYSDGTMNWVGYFLLENGEIFIGQKFFDYSQGTEKVTYHSPISLGNIQKTTENDYNLSTVCALDSKNDVYCWGNNEYGQVGDGTYDSTKIGEVGYGVYDHNNLYNSKKVMSDVKDVKAVGYTTMCALKNNGELWCWGRAPYDGAFGENISKVNTPLMLRTNVSELGADINSKQMLYDNGTYSFLDYSYSGYEYFTDGSIRYYDSSSGYSILAESVIDSSGSTLLSYYLYYINKDQQLIRLSLTDVYEKNIFSTEKFVDLHNNITGVCGITSDGSVSCWGKNSSQGKLFGEENQALESSETPIKISGIESAVSFSQYNHYSNVQVCVLTSSNTIQCWGDDLDGIITITP